MANLTIKQIDERVLDRLRAQARKRNLSLNAYLKDVLARLIGLQPGVKTYTDLSDLAGCWSEEEAEEFGRNTEQFTRIDEELWK
jgi:hypothetical protein